MPISVGAVACPCPREWLRRQPVDIDVNGLRGQRQATAPTDNTVQISTHERVGTAACPCPREWVRRLPIDIDVNGLCGQGQATAPTDNTVQISTHERVGTAACPCPKAHACYGFADRGKPLSLRVEIDPLPGDDINERCAQYMAT